MKKDVIILTLGSWLKWNNESQSGPKDCLKTQAKSHKHERMQKNEFKTLPNDVHSQMMYTWRVVVPHESWTFGPNIQVINMVQIRFLIYH
jgi:hypothetical protein